MLTYLNSSEGANANVVDDDPYNLDDMKDNPNYDASAETLTDEPSDIGLFDMIIPNEPCMGNNFANYGENGIAAIINHARNITLDFALKAMRTVSETSNIPTTLPRGRVDGFAFVTQSEPNFVLTNGKMKMLVDEMGDQHGSYSSKNSAAEKMIYQFDHNTKTFKMNRRIGYSVDKDLLYWKGQLKPGVVPIPHLIKVNQ